MRKILAIFIGVFMLMGCGEQQTTFKGYEYKMLNTPNDVNVTISFDAEENRYFGKVVNNFFGLYMAEGNDIAFAPAASTMMMGIGEAMDVEREVLQNLLEIRSYKFDGGKLIFNLEGGRTLEFKKIGEVKKVSEAETPAED
ncbi:MAG: META domain-containing protein [Lactobacillaceae bacterium]|jgi:heat shock protein HslJ|nr:META domain-containing protein [Lactobacillaceae bacterium]